SAILLGKVHELSGRRIGSLEPAAGGKSDREAQHCQCDLKRRAARPPASTPIAPATACRRFLMGREHGVESGVQSRARLLLWQRSQLGPGGGILPARLARSEMLLDVEPH